MTATYNTPWKTKRIVSDTVNIGDIEMGSNFPVRVQSMANTFTNDIESSIKQAIEIIEAGGELVRYTVINEKDADALKYIKTGLVEKGYNTPLVADVHFNPLLADITAKYVDKVRINPGNYVDKRATFQQVDFNDEEYVQELERLKERFVSFLNICKENNTAVRIGTNHGSLSDRIMSRYGDTPDGMVEATMEFLRICKAEKFNNIVVSLKSSNTRVMVQAYRLLVEQMQSEDMSYCIHLGVTEAGSAEDGRIKSAVGIGTLMQEGIGDTIRVSLTEHPANEIPVAKHLVNHFLKKSNYPAIGYNNNKVSGANSFEKRATLQKKIIGGENVPVVMTDISDEGEINADMLVAIGFEKNEQAQAFVRGDQTPDIIYTGENTCLYRIPEDIVVVMDGRHWNNDSNAYPLFSWEEYSLDPINKSAEINFVQAGLKDLNSELFELLKNDDTIVLIAYSMNADQTAEIAAFINELQVNGCKAPVIVQQIYKSLSEDDFILESAADNGLFFIDGLADGIWLKHVFKTSAKQVVETSFAILQAARSRTTKTEYISCPGCGRTLFDLEATLAKVKQETSHLKGLKIAVMGCIVNGPGEMADADYGYVGAGAGKVMLYKNKELVKKNIDTADAVKELLLLIEESENK